MTLKDILARLERIEHMSPGYAQCEMCDEDVEIEDSDLPEAIAELRRDIEMYLIRTEGTLRT